MRHVFASASAVSLIACLGVAPVFAQTSSTAAADTPDTANSTSSSSSMPSADGSNGTMKSSSDVTCEELSRMDVAMVPGVLYFIAGSEHGMNAAKGSGAMDSSGNSAGMDQSAASTSGTDTSGTATGSATTSTDTTAGSDTSASSSSTTMDQGSSTTASGDTGTTGSDTTSGGDQMADMSSGAVPIMGFYPIPIKETIVACGKEPTRKAADVMKEQHGNASNAAQ